MSIKNDTKRAPAIGLTLLLGHFAAIITFSTHHQDATMFHGYERGELSPMDQLGKGGMALHQHARLQRNFQLIRQLYRTILFMLPTSICEKDEWYSIVLEESQGFSGSWEGIGTPEEYSINAILMC